MVRRKGSCQHRWRIDSPSGRARVKGVCKKCGVRRTYPVLPKGIKQLFLGPKRDVTRLPFVDNEEYL